MLTVLEKLKLLTKALETKNKIEYFANDTWNECDEIEYYIMEYFNLDVRLKPDPFKELKKAYANGKTIQISSVYTDQVCSNNEVEIWDDCIPQWAPNRKYRVKPEPVDLDVSDFTIHTLLRNTKTFYDCKWFKIASLHDKGVRTQSGGPGLSFSTLRKYGWEMSEDGVNWKPCHK